jgi:hypothetical protein
MTYLLTFSGILQLLCTLVVPTALAYVLAFRLQNIAKEDFRDRYWNAERQRGVRAGRDEDGSGTVENSERIKVSLVLDTLSLSNFKKGKCRVVQ